MNLIRIFIIFIILVIIISIIFFYNKKRNIDVYLISSNDTKDIEIDLISLPKDETRRKQLKIKPDCVYSVNGSTLNKDELIKSNILDKNVNLKKGQIGCYLSHIHFLKKAIDSKKKYVLIIEDDAKIDNDLFNKIDIILKNAPKDFEMIFLGHNYYKEKKEHFELKKINYLHGAQAYIVNTKNITLEKINTLFPIKKPYDVIVPEKFKCYVVEPKIVTLTNFNYSNTGSIN